jgi:hypothetical protein
MKSGRIALVLGATGNWRRDCPRTLSGWLEIRALGERRSIHDRLSGQRISLGITNTVGVAVGTGASHHFAHFGIDRRAVRNALWGNRDGQADGSKSTTKSGKELRLPESHS